MAAVCVFLFKLTQIRPPPPIFDNRIIRKLNMRVLYTIELLEVQCKHSIQNWFLSEFKKYHDEKKYNYANQAGFLTNIWVLRVYAPDEPPNIEVQAVGDARFRATCSPSLSEITGAVNWITRAGTAGPEQPGLINTRVPCGGNVQIFRDYGRGGARIKVNHIVKQRPRPRLLRESKSSRCWDIAIQIQWLQLNCRLTVGLRITELRN